MNWQIVVGILFIIGSVGCIADGFSNFLFALLFGIGCFYWGLRKKGYIKKNRPSSPPKQYVVLDIETTGFSREKDRIIEIAANRYSRGKLVKQYHTYVNPGRSIPATITELTGITDQDVMNAPTISTIKKEFLSFLGTDPIVGHNITSFDLPFIQARLKCHIDNTLYDTLSLSKSAFPGLRSYKLEYLNRVFHLSELEHHRASNDIVITNKLFLASLNPSEYTHFMNDKLPSIKSEQTSHSKIDIHSITPSDSNSTPNTRLTGKNIVFTGELSISREKAMQIAVDAGAVLKSSVSKKTDYLVVGKQDKRVVGESGMSKKEAYAKTLIEEGNGKPEIIDENTFIKLAKDLTSVI